MEKRRVTVRIGGQICSFFTDDSEEYILALERRANAVMKQTAPFSGPSANMNAALSIVFLMDTLMRAEEKITEITAGMQSQPPASPESKQPRKQNKVPAEDKSQISVWELLEE